MLTPPTSSSHSSSPCGLACSPPRAARPAGRRETGFARAAGRASACASHHPASCRRAQSRCSAVSDTSSRSRVSSGSACVAPGLVKVPLHDADRAPVLGRQAAARLRRAPAEAPQIRGQAKFQRIVIHALGRIATRAAARRSARIARAPCARRRHWCASPASRAAAAPCPRSARNSVPSQYRFSTSCDGSSSWRRSLTGDCAERTPSTRRSGWCTALAARMARARVRSTQTSLLPPPR